jgi:hypothetical protein
MTREQRLEVAVKALTDIKRAMENGDGWAGTNNIEPSAILRCYDTSRYALQMVGDTND